MMRQSRNKGNVFALMFAAVAMMGVVGVVGMQTVSGPITTITKVTQKNIVDTDVMTNGRIVILNAATRANADTDPEIEPVPFIPCTGTTPINAGGCLPGDIGAVRTDPWGTQYGYCVWNHGTENTGLVGTLDGDLVNDGYVVAVISAGPNKTFETGCYSYDGSAPEGLSPEVGAGMQVTGTDDIARAFTYQEAVVGSGGLWDLVGNNAVLDTSQVTANLQMGSNASLNTVDGIADFFGLIVDEIIAKTNEFMSLEGALLLDNAGTTTADTCSAAQDGALRLNTALDALEICNGAAFVPLVADSWRIIDSSHGSNTYVSVAGTTNTDTNAIDFVTAGSPRMTISPAGVVDIVGDTDIGGNLTADGNTTLGDALTDTVVTGGNTTIGQDLTVNRDATITGNARVNGNSILGNGAGDLTTVFEDLTVGRDATITQNLGVNGNSILGNDAGDLTTVFEDLTVGRDATITQNLGVNGNSVLGNDAGDLTTVFEDLTVGRNATITNTIKIGSGTCSTGADEGKIQYTTANEVQYCDGAGWQQLGGAVDHLDDIGDVVITAVAVDHGIKWDGTNWVNGPLNASTAVSATNSRKIIDADGDTQIQVEEGADDDTIRFDTLGSKRMVITSTGNVGIGITPPNTKLQVAGDLLLGTATTCGASQKGALRLNSTANGLQMCDGAGNWDDYGGGGGGMTTGMIAAFESATCPSGWNEYTLARGRFLRGIDPTGTNDVVRTAGNLQDDEFKSHDHKVIVGSGVLGAGPSTNAPNDDPQNYSFKDDTFAMQGILKADFNGGTETRPKNVAVIYCQYSGSGGGSGSDTLAGLSCTDGQVAAWNNTTSAWECADAGGGGGGSGVPIIDKIAEQVTVSPFTITATGNKWPDYLVCDNGVTNDQIILTLSQHLTGTVVRYILGATGENSYSFTPTGTYSTRAGVSSNCGAPANDIESICNDGRCGFFGSGGTGGGTGGAGADIAFTVTKTTQQTLATGALINWEAKTTDIGNNFDLVTDKFTAPVDGTYYFHASLLSGNDSTSGVFNIFRNNVNTGLRAHGTASATSWKPMVAQGVLQLVAGDTIDLRSELAGQTLFGSNTVGSVTTFTGFLLNGGAVSSDANTCPGSYLNGKCYVIIQTSLSRTNARLECAKLGPGGDLAMIKSAEIQRLLFNLYTAQAGAMLWTAQIEHQAYVGGKKSDGVWKWEDNSAMTYTNWEPVEPSGNGTALVMRGLYSGKWDDQPGTIPLWFFCEY